MSPSRAEIVSEIFECIAKAGINVDIIVHNKSEHRNAMRLGFSIFKNDLESTLDLLDSWRKDINSDVIVEHEADMAKVSVVGLGMQSHPGVASRCFALLASAGIEIHMISTSEIKISCVVAADKADAAAQALHDGFVAE